MHDFLVNARVNTEKIKFVEAKILHPILEKYVVP